MHAFPRTLRLVLPLLLLSPLAPAQSPAYTPGPVPPAILHAHKIFLGNAGADSGLFPQPFGGDPNRPYDQFFAALQSTGEYQLVSDPTQADLILELRLIGPTGPKYPDKQYGSPDPVPEFRLKIYSPASPFLLWAITESVEPALLQRTHDRNFDDALSRLLADFQAIRHITPHRPAAQTPTPPPPAR